VEATSRFARAVLLATALMTTALEAMAQTDTAASPDPCPVYLVAWDDVMSRDSSVIVVYDSTSLATPTFAFHAWTGMPSSTDSLFPNADSLFQSLRATLAPRRPLPTCLEEQRPARRATYAAMQAPFRDRERGWELFTEAFPGARRLALFSHVLWIAGEQPTAVLYVATASHWLAGGGDLLLLAQRNGRWTVVARKALWRS
jgi:hypothetical protein